MQWTRRQDATTRQGCKYISCIKTLCEKSPEAITFWNPEARKPFFECCCQRLTTLSPSSSSHFFHSLNLWISSLPHCDFSCAWGVLPCPKPRTQRVTLTTITYLSPATPLTTRWSLVNVPVLSKQQTSTLPAKGMRKGSVQYTSRREQRKVCDTSATTTPGQISSFYHRTEAINMVFSSPLWSLVVFKTRTDTKL